MKGIVKNTLITIAVLCVAFGASIFLQDVLTVDEHITTLFVFLHILYRIKPWSSKLCRAS